MHIDPPGFALENFDPIGNWREFYRVTERTKAGVVELPRNTGRPAYRGPDVEQGGETPEGKAVQGHRRLQEDPARTTRTSSPAA